MSQRVEDVADERPRGMSLRTLLVVIAAIGLVVFCVAGWPMELLFYLAAGWGYFLARVGPQIRFNMSGILTALGAITLFVVGLHIALGWLYRSTGPTGDVTPRRWRRRWTAGLSALVLVVFMSGMAALGCLHQIGWMATSPEPLVGNTSSYRAVSGNNLKQIILAAHNYHDDKGNTFPPGYTAAADGRLLHGLYAQFLPYIEEEALFARIQFDKPWDHEANRPALQTKLRVYQSPRIAEKSDAGGYAFTHYAGNVRTFPATRGLSIKGGFPDGTSNTLMFGEVNAGFRPWGHPLNLRDPAKGLRPTADAFYGPWAGGMTQFALVDGSVRKLSPTISPATLNALATPAGGEWIDEKDW